ncbi:MAG: type II toxin-antitoxin system HigB family toxin [Pararobbsia sp.]
MPSARARGRHSHRCISAVEARGKPAPPAPSCYRSIGSVNSDKADEFYVLDIGGNKYRLIAAAHINRQMLFVRHVFTHKEYDKWKP